MRRDVTKSERKKIRQLAGIVWERELRHEIQKIANAICKMDAAELSPFDVNDRIHKFHTGISRELYNRYSGSDPWFAVCRARLDGVLTDGDLADASDSLKDRIRQFVTSFADLHPER